MQSDSSKALADWTLKMKIEMNENKLLTPLQIIFWVLNDLQGYAGGSCSESESEKQSEGEVEGVKIYGQYILSIHFPALPGIRYHEFPFTSTYAQPTTHPHLIVADSPSRNCWLGCVSHHGCPHFFISASQFIYRRATYRYFSLITSLPTLSIYLSVYPKIGQSCI